MELSLLGNKIRGNCPYTILAALRASPSLTILKELRLTPTQFNTAQAAEELCNFVAEATGMTRLEISGQCVYNPKSAETAPDDRRVKVEMYMGSASMGPNRNRKGGNVRVYDPDLKQTLESCITMSAGGLSIVQN